MDLCRERLINTVSRSIVTSNKRRKNSVTTQSNESNKSIKLAVSTGDQSRQDACPRGGKYAARGRSN